MKLANYISMCGIALCLLSACDSDLEKITYDEGTAKPAVLEELNASYTLDAAKANEVAFTCKWSKPEAGYQAAITNSLEISLAGNEFKGAVVLASSNDKNAAEITVIALNRAMLKLLNDVMPAQPVDVEFRILSSISNAGTPFASNVVKTKISPYSMEKEYPFIAVRGSYATSWEVAQSQKIYSKDENYDYAALIFFGEGKAIGGWKLGTAESWDEPNWGYSTGATEAESIMLTLGGGSDIKNYSKCSYYMKFNKQTCTLQMTKGHNSWGINKKGESSADSKLALSSPTVNGVVTFMLTATVELSAGDLWRIRPDDNDQDAITPADASHALSVEGDYFKADEDGMYLVTWIFNKVTPQIYITKQ